MFIMEYHKIVFNNIIYYYLSLSTAIQLLFKREPLKQPNCDHFFRGAVIFIVTCPLQGVCIHVVNYVIQMVEIMQPGQKTDFTQIRM